MGRAPAEVEERLGIEGGGPGKGADVCQVGLPGSRCRRADWGERLRGSITIPSQIDCR